MATREKTGKRTKSKLYASVTAPCLWHDRRWQVNDHRTVLYFTFQSGLDTNYRRDQKKTSWVSIYEKCKYSEVAAQATEYV